MFDQFIGSNFIGLIAIVKFCRAIKHCNCNKAIEHMYYIKIVLYYIILFSTVFSLLNIIKLNIFKNL